jgi:hypothetical protein
LLLSKARPPSKSTTTWDAYSRAPGSQTEVRKPDTGVAGLRAAEPGGRYPGAGRPYLARRLTKSRAELGEWCQQVAVSTALRK